MGEVVGAGLAASVRSSTSLALAVVIPAASATLAVLTFSGLELAGHTPFSYGPPRNVAEAAATANAAEVLRLLRAGEDLNQVWPVRRDIISSQVPRATALEAAVWSKHVQLVRLLDRRGAIANREIRFQLACLARDIRSQEIVDYLIVPASPPCVSDEAFRAVVARSVNP